MAINDLYRLTYFFENQGVTCLNVYHYKQLAGGATNGASNLNQAFFNTVYNPIRNALPVDVSITGIRVENLLQNSDFFENMGVNDPGLYESVSGLAPSWLAAQFVSPRPYPGTRSARKRFPFLVENDLNGNLLDVSSAPRVALWNALGVAIGNEVSNLTYLYTPVVVYDASEGVGPTRLWTERYAISSYALSPRIASQDSRKA